METEYFILINTLYLNSYFFLNTVQNVTETQISSKVTRVIIICININNIDHILKRHQRIHKGTNPKSETEKYSLRKKSSVMSGQTGGARVDKLAAHLNLS